jgi:hypothetical protein
MACGCWTITAMASGMATKPLPSAGPVRSPWSATGNGNGKTKIGIYAGGFWYLDYNGTFDWNTRTTAQFGWSGTVPVLGDLHYL